LAAEGVSGTSIPACVELVGLAANSLTCEFYWLGGQLCNGLIVYGPMIFASKYLESLFVKFRFAQLPFYLVSKSQFLLVEILYLRICMESMSHVFSKSILHIDEFNFSTGLLRRLHCAPE
jgi:hypothetical protein